MDSIQLQLDAALALLQANRITESVQAYLKILSVVPRQPDALYMLGLISHKLGQSVQAIAWLEAAEKETPKAARIYALKGIILKSLKRTEEALPEALRAIELDPTLPEAWDCAGYLYMDLNQWQNACRHFERAVVLAPNNPTLRSYYALSLSQSNCLSEAYEQTVEALQLDPKSPMAMITRAEILCHAGYYDLAVPCYREAQQYPSVRQTALFGEAYTSFITGAFERGLELLASTSAYHEVGLPLPDWQGQRDEKLHLILYGEQGYGDMLHFMRYAKILRDRVGSVTMRLPYHLLRLIRQSMPDMPLMAYKDPATDVRNVTIPAGITEDLPQGINRRSSYTALPHCMGAPFDPRVADIPYLHADSELRKAWRERLAKIPAPKIGFAWAGSPRHLNDSNRSIPLITLAPLIALAKPHLVSLQFGFERKIGLAAGLYDATPYLSDFADSAALLAELDLLITADSAPAHLAGAMGLPVWIMIPFNPDWRWLLGREDTIWYKTVKLYRQLKPHDWTNVVQSICNDVERFFDNDVSVLKPTSWQGKILQRHPQAVALKGVK